MLVRRNPVVVSATQWTASGGHPLVRQLEPEDDWKLAHTSELHLPLGRSSYGVLDLGYTMWLVNPGDWIITDPTGAIYPCAKHIFEKSYDALGE